MKKILSRTKETLNKRKKTLIVGASSVLLLAGGAAGTAAYAMNKGTLSESEASSLVTKEMGGEVTRVEKDWEDGPTYEMTVKTDEGYQDVDLDAKNGAVLSVDQDDDEWEEEVNQDMKKDVKLSLEDAEKKALKEVNGKVTDAELDMENGKPVYELEVEKDQKEYDIDIDANTEEVLKVEMDD